MGGRDNLEINYDFRELDRGSGNGLWRWSPSEEANADLRERLTLLNRERFEVAVSSSGAFTATKSKRGRRPKIAPSVILDGLFDEGDL